MVQSQPDPVQTQSYTIMLSIMQQYCDLTLSVDILKISNIPFLMTISKHIKFGSAGKLDILENKTIISHFNVFIGVNVIRGFWGTIILANNQFESMRGNLADIGAIVNIVSLDEHRPKIEWYNCTTKEVKSAYNVLSFQ